MRWGTACLCDATNTFAGYVSCVVLLLVKAVPGRRWLCQRKWSPSGRPQRYSAVGVEEVRQVPGRTAEAFRIGLAGLSGCRVRAFELDEIGVQSCVAYVLCGVVRRRKVKRNSGGYEPLRRFAAGFREPELRRLKHDCDMRRVAVHFGLHPRGNLHLEDPDAVVFEHGAVVFRSNCYCIFGHDPLLRIGLDPSRIRLRSAMHGTSRPTFLESPGVKKAPAAATCKGARGREGMYAAPVQAARTETIDDHQALSPGNPRKARFNPTSCPG